jgi:hypothetical protein
MNIKEANALKLLTVLIIIWLTFSMLSFVADKGHVLQYGYQYSAEPIKGLFSFMAALVCLCCVYVLRNKLVALLPGILSLWLILSTLQQYYSVLNFNILVIIGIALEMIALSLGAFILIRKSV